MAVLAPNAGAGGATCDLTGDRYLDGISERVAARFLDAGLLLRFASGISPKPVD